MSLKYFFVFLKIISALADDSYISKIDTYYSNTIIKSESIESTNYNGGCIEHPPAPIYGTIECSTIKGCRANCNPNYQFPNGETQLIVTCNQNEWQIIGTEWNTIPHCEPICLPQCYNNGICVAPNECRCPENFSGPQCQYEIKPCLNLPAPVLGARRHCNSKTCTITCMNNFTFPDGSSITNLICRDGNWIPTRTEWVSIPDCKPTCSPACENGGICLTLNTCQCPQDFRGPQCQYSADACTPQKLGFNGGYHCRGEADYFACTLNCPEEVEFSFAPAAEYICTYEKGVFEPQPIPQCKNGPDYQIVPIGSSKNSFFKITNHSWIIEDTSMSQSSYRNELRNFMNFEGNGKLTLKTKGVKTGHVSIESINKKYQDQISHTHSTIDQNSLVIEEKKPESKTCFSWGGVHYKTFDGAIYSFESNCAHTLIQETQYGTFTITIQNHPDCYNGGTCSRITRFFLQGKEFILLLNEDGLPTFRTVKKVLPIPAQLSGVRVEMSAHFVIVNLDTVGASLKWDGGLFVQIKASESLWNKTAGLCGRMNGYPEDDKTGKDYSHSKNTAAFASTWKVLNIGESCDENPRTQHSCDLAYDLTMEAEEFCSTLFSDTKFQACSKIVDLAKLQSTCQWDYCACKKNNRKQCACDTMSVYIRQCFHDHVIDSVAWRREETCPMTCTGGKVYKSCGPKSQPTCSNDIVEHKENNECEEGCFCPEGTVLLEGKCISVEECPCTLRGKFFPPGTTIPKECNTCTCSAGKWICTSVTCSARCSAVGDPHYVTFDGKHYDFMGQCNYYLLKGDNYSIETENIACAGAISEAMGLSRSSMDETSCTKSVTIRWNEILIKLKQNNQVLINGEDITKLPVMLSGVKIKIASSIFIVVNVPNGLEIWWDGISRVYVNAPADFRGKTKGLCGTFTANQKDDFLTPIGDVEDSVIPFANKWKTSEQCTDMPMKDFRHPCDINPERLTTAEKHCSKLLSDLFSSCHWHVDPNLFYEDCKYDMCACEAEIERCLCPTLSAYAKECAVAGVKLLWRTEIEECQLHCPAGQEYQICGNSCTRSCSDISFDQDCRQECVEGCNCPEGQTLNALGQCIPIGECPCQYNGMEFNAGYQEVRPGRQGQDLCTCARGNWACQLATTEDIEKYPAAIDLKTVCTASKNLEVTTCEPAEPRTCRNMHEPIKQTPAICHAGCTCKSGYVLDSSSGVCVEEEKCPCYHGSKSYKEGSVMQEDCNTCKCERGAWKCSDRICPGVCSAWGDSHFKTFDDKTYDFQGVCDYVFTKASFGKDEMFEISLQNVPCGSTGVSCSKSVTLKVGNGNNQEIITLTRDKSIPNDSFKRLAIRHAGLFVFVDVPDLGLVLQWDKGTRVYVKLDPKWKGRTKGLCGDYNNNSEDDFKTPSGGISEVSAGIFANSWKKDNYCPEPKDITDTCDRHPERKLWAIQKCGVLKSSIFQPCHSEVDIEPFVQRCIFDTCGCDGGGDCECLCTALAAYAQECNRKSIPIKWRSQDLCPMQCDESCSSYSPCLSTCPQETCDSLTFTNVSKLCVQDTCVEGCLTKSCPEGEVYRNSTLKECVPKALCKPLCLEIEGVIYYEGDKVSSDACQTCFCSRGKIICNGAPCVSSSIEPSTVPMEQSEKCVDGWTAWINTYTPKKTANAAIKGKKSKPAVDTEPLPSMITLLGVNSTRCSKEHMVDIRCRTVNGHKTPKETGLNVECSLERGLYCQSEDKVPCEDFEISVLCRCSEETTATPELSSTTSSTLITEDCDVNHPNQAHPSDCHAFYQCLPSGHLVKKTCGVDMMYNPVMQICDWPNNVMKLRPDCGQITTKSPQCKEGERWDECAIQCSKTCEYYRYILTEKNLCSDDKECIPGCVNDENICPPHKFWRDSHSCVEEADCPCKSHDGKVVKPGAVIAESECERCQCLRNYYTCDKSYCTTTPPSLPTSPTTQAATTIEDHTIITVNTVSPAEPCVSKQYRSLLDTNKIDKQVIFNASSIAGIHYKPEFAKLKSSHTKSVAFKSWQPEFMDSEQWIEIKFPRLEPIYGIVMQGNPGENKYVTSYKVLFSQNGETFSFIQNQNKPQIFQGPIDSSTPVKQFFSEPIEAKIIRINPQTWHHGIAIRLDLLGCQDHVTTQTTYETTVASTTKLYETIPTTVSPIVEEIINNPVCDDAMGLDSGVMVEEQVIASSTLDNLVPNIRLSSPGIWQAALDNPNQFVQFDFLDNRNLTGVETKGADNIWTTAYKVFYGDNERQWLPVLNSEGTDKIFLGNFDDQSSKINYFEKPIRSRYLKIQPIKWHEHVGLKAEIHGCYEPYDDKKVISLPIKKLESKCNVCHSMFENLAELDCKCNGSLWWNGETCVEKQLCPCVVEHLPYSVGSTFETSDCQKCLCAMGGVPDCQPKICEPCDEPNMRSIVTELCGCVCRPCPDDMVLCPTSKICIKKSSWCDGVKDCLDDETNCKGKLPEPTSTHTSQTQTEMNYTTVEIKKVTKLQCEKPVCPEGYKLASLKKPSPTKSTYSPIKGGVKGRITGGVKGGVKGGAGRQRPIKEPRKNDSLKFNDSKSIEMECEQFSCKPTRPPPIFNKEIQEVPCPKVKCPSNYRVIYEPLSMYTPVACPKYICKPPPPVEVVCNVTGRTFNTFDNLEYKYEICNHILAREMYQNNWFITLEKHCDKRNQPCIQVLVINVDSNTILLYPDMHVDIDQYTFTPKQVNRLHDRRGTFKISRIGNIIHFISTKYGFWVIWDQNSNIKIGITTMLAHHVDGLCGFFDGLMKNDRQKPDGSQAISSKDFGDSWVMDGTPECEHQNCPRYVLEEARNICNSVTDRSFAVCKNVIAVDKWISRCLESTCMCINGNMTSEECRCRALNSFASECQAADTNIDLSTWRNIHNCVINCPAPFVYKDCFRNKCETSCDNLQEIEPCPLMEGVCFSGCFCPDGTVRKGDICIPPSECRDCVCNGFGNANFVNFNKKNFTFTGNCTYVLSQDISKSNNEIGPGDHTYEILMTNVPCDRGVCTESLSVFYKGHYIQIEQMLHSKDFILTVDGESIESLPYKNSWMSFERVGNYDVVFLISAIQLGITSYRNNFAFTITLPSHIFGGATEGLCGNCNLNDEEDFKKANGEYTNNIDEFGSSWLAVGIPHARFLSAEDCTSQPIKKCTPPPANNDPCAIMANPELFGQCHNLVDPTPFIHSCYDTHCENGNICGDIEAYARNCRDVGLCPSWRTNDMCPYSCPMHLEYHACGPSCLETCETLNDVNTRQCSQEITEGCFCPKNHVLHNDTCVPEKLCFICDNEGHVEGDVWHPDKCTTCSCKNKVVNCQTTECPVLETICQDNYTPVEVPGHDGECCLKYLCVPVPTIPPTCVEPQQLECGYGQVMKLITDPDGCQKIICQCMTPEECISLIGTVSPEVEKENIQPGFVQEMDMTGCCPRPVLACKLETCPTPKNCSRYYNSIKLKEAPGACCPTYECEPPKDLCLYNVINSNDVTNENLIAKKVGETWKDGPCVSCVCEKSSDELPKPSCLTTECPNIHSNPDFDDFVLEEKVLIGQCCPRVERVACRNHDIIYNVGQEWYLNPSDTCVIVKCENTTTGVRKTTINQECNTACDKGYEYNPSKDKGVKCCGECVAVACVVNGTLKNIGEQWYSEDFCTNYECISDNRDLRVKELTTQCEILNSQEEELYEIEEEKIFGQCCPKYTRTGCRSDGKVYRPSSTWKNSADSCITEICAVGAEKIELQRTVQNCNTSCEFGWEYQSPEEGQCCGRCIPAFCVVDGILYNPDSVWYSEDNCTTYECQFNEGQMVISTSSRVCPDVFKCPLKDIYNDGCCNACNMTTLDLQKTCMAEVLELDTTIGIISEKRGKHGICRNVAPIDGLTECHGICESSTHYNPVSWVQETNCQCCQPIELKELIVNIVCEDGKLFLKRIQVPTACACNGCKAMKHIKGHKPGVKG
ncbi:hemocytin isoform X1 [Cotesia glomerata]|uniref:hemocytin isoform X1 n=1 Tax=Cotesia glomerata TaxID=32391 RepID=UPI001D01CC7B|nr:hemocytin isoform X1 [Cotesia glomerata]